MAKIDITKIEGYDTMTPEQKLAALETYEYDDGSGALKTIREQLSKATGDAAKYKRELEQSKKSSDDEMTKLQNRLAELEKRGRIAAARARFMAIGCTEESAKDMAECFGDVTLDDSVADRLFDGLKKHFDEVRKKAKSDAMTGVSKPKGGSEQKAMTLEEFRKMSADERAEFAHKNPEDYERLYGGN